jgi:hypothetical protein
MKDALCKAFCDNLSVRTVKGGLAISAPFENASGEPIGFYIVPNGTGMFHIEDDGTTMPMLEACGVDFTTEARRVGLQELLTECGAIYDGDRGDLRTLPMPEGDIPNAARRFVSLLLRMQDFLMLTQEKVLSAFRADATRHIRSVIGNRATIQDNGIVTESLAEFPADLVIRAPQRDPVAVIFGVSESRVKDALMLQMAAQYEAHVPCSVIALLEHQDALTSKTRARAANRLAAVASFRGDEAAAVNRIEREVFGHTVAAGNA